jgi:hypothetical protein
MMDRGTVIDTGDGGAAAFVAGALIVALIVGGFFFFFGINHSDDRTITVDVPKVVVKVAPSGQ